MRLRPQSHKRRHGFTLVEIIIVVMLVGMIAAWGLPTFVQTFKRQPLQQAVNDFMEGCASARAAAILTGTPAEFVISASEAGTSLRVQSSAAGSSVSADGGAGTADSSGFTAQMPEGIAFEMLAVNFQDSVQSGEGVVRVRFYPNGTCDEFTAVMFEPSTNKRRMVHLDVVTGHAEMKTEAELAAMK
ncbi:MAG TPA: prepilin-type N-terminal cleavage/methylation domain-containing protein [Verrucomicrobiae bacterium]